MEAKNLYRLGPAISRVRREHDVPQKVLASAIGVDSSRLSGLENGRRRGPANALVERISEALGLSELEKRALLGAAGHDRAMREVTRNYPVETLPLLALSLDAARLLSAGDRDKLASFIRELIGPRERLTTVSLPEGITMT